MADMTAAGNPAEAPQGVMHELRRDSAASARAWHTRLTPAEIARVRAATEAVAPVFYGEDEWPAAD